MAGRDGPEDMANASFLVIASVRDRGFGLFVADPFCDGIHPRLAGERVTQVHVLQSALRKGEGRPERRGIEKIQGEGGFLKAPQLEQPAVPEIRRSFQRPVFAIIIVPRDGNGIVWIIEDRKVIAPGIVNMAQTEIRGDLDLADKAWSPAEKVAKKLANLSRHH
jgi:hypothetical protein